MGSELCSCEAGMARLSSVGWKPLQFCKPKPRNLQEVTLSLDVLTVVLSLGGSQGRSP